MYLKCLKKHNSYVKSSPENFFNQKSAYCLFPFKNKMGSEVSSKLCVYTYEYSAGLYKIVMSTNASSVLLNPS